jgi:septum formation protein
LVLASASPRRAELLRAAGLTFETLVVEIDETVRNGESPAAYVRRLAMEKSAAAYGPAKAGHYVRRENVRRENVPRENVRRETSEREREAYVVSGFSRTIEDDGLVVLAADTTVVVDGEILGKPRDGRDAERMLRRLSGRRHEVLTGVSLRCNELERGLVETTAVELAPLGDVDLAWYVASGEGRDKAGAYAIQGLASRFITRIDGSYSNVVGLPVHTVFTLLQEWRETGYSV